MNQSNLASRTSFVQEIAENIAALEDSGESYGIWWDQLKGSRSDFGSFKIAKDDGYAINSLPANGTSSSTATCEMFQKVLNVWDGWGGMSSSTAIHAAFHKRIDAWSKWSKTSGLTVTSERSFSCDFKGHQLQERVTDTVPDVISESWNHFVTNRLSEKAYLKILKLANKNDGWRGTGSLSLNTKSLQAFLRFWNQLIEISEEPDFVLMPNGNLQTEWYKNDNHFIELEFQPNNKIIFGIFDGDTEHEGVASVKEVGNILKERDFKKFKQLVGKVA
jgi:hypothetical protein